MAVSYDLSGERPKFTTAELLPFLGSDVSLEMFRGETFANKLKQCVANEEQWLMAKKLEDLFKFVHNEHLFCRR